MPFDLKITLIVLLALVAINGVVMLVQHRRAGRQIPSTEYQEENWWWRIK